MLEELKLETFLATTIVEVAGLSDIDLKTEHRALRRKQRMGKLGENDFTRLTFVEMEIQARKEEND